MAQCKQCEEQNLTWSREGERWKLAEKNGDPHQCKLMTVPLYTKILNEYPPKDAGKFPIFARYREERIANYAVNICMQNGLDPYLTEWEQDITGMFLKIKKAVRMRT